MAPSYREVAIYREPQIKHKKKHPCKAIYTQWQGCLINQPFHMQLRWSLSIQTKIKLPFFSFNVFYKHVQPMAEGVITMKGNSVRYSSRREDAEGDAGDKESRL